MNKFRVIFDLDHPIEGGFFSSFHHGADQLDVLFFRAVELLVYLLF
jgi:hypothetical protein